MLIAALLRIYCISHGISFHPDERHIVMVAERLNWDDMNPHFFAYGSFPFYLLWAVAELLGLIWPYLKNYDGLFLVGRHLSALFGIIAGLLTYFLSKKVSNDKFAAILAATFLLFNVFHIQLSRFYAFDGVLTTVCLAVLLSCISISHEKSSWKSFFCAGIFLGIAVATKISALSLLLPFGIAVLLKCFSEKRFISLRMISNCLLFLVIALVTFTATEPYAWLDWETFIANNNEQISMVQGKWRPPYTVQYANTIPYIYPLQQILEYTIGWPVGILGLAGILIASVRQFKKINPAALIILSWMIVTYLIIAGYQVKFPRYLLPLYPIVFIFAGIFLSELKSLISNKFTSPFFPRALVGLFIIYVFIRAIAFVSIYSSPHTYETASRWIFNNVQEGARIAHGHWDDTLPLHLPGLNPSIYNREGREFELPLYEPENPEKLDLITSRVANVDYIFFPTPRIIGSIPRVPDDFPQTTTFLQLLLSENLGFELAQSFKVWPEFGFYRLNDDLADESFSVYDHPKALIFKNTARLSAEEIKSRILAPSRFEPLPTREEMLLLNSSGKITKTTSDGNSLISFIVWCLTLQILGILAIPILAKACPTLPDKGYALTKITGIFILGFFSWYLTSLQVLPASSSALYFLIAIFAIVSFKISPKAQWWKRYFRENYKRIICCEVLFWSVFILFTVIRALNPEIFWGEKPMDLSFLNYFLRSDVLPPEDPWAAGNNMRYYYLGTYFISLLLKITGINAAYGYNLAISTLAPICILSFFAIIYYLTRKLSLAVIGSCSAVLLSNFEILNLIFVEGKKLNFDTFWASTRFFTPPAFSEYPVWSFLFADLHAHVIALCFTSLLLALSIPLIDRPANRQLASYWIHRILYATLLGSLMAFNTWDFIIYSGLTFILICLQPIYQEGNKPIKLLLKRCLNILTENFIIGIFAIVTIAPYFIFTKPSDGASWGWNHTFEYNSISSILKHFGMWFLLLLVGFIFATTRRTKSAKTLTWLNVVFAVIFGTLPIILGIICYAVGLKAAPWATMILSSLIIELSILGIMLIGHLSVAARFGFACAILAAAVLTMSEVFFLIDRMNTVFKFYSGLWFLFACSGLSLLLYIFSRLPKKRYGKFSKIGFYSLRSCLVFVAVACSVGTLANIYITITFQRVEGNRPTLNGLDYLRQSNLDEYELVNWINHNIRGIPYTLEAQGSSYGEYTRIAMYTGLPTLMGWDHHTKQRGTSSLEVAKRMQAVEDAYTSTNPEVADEILHRYGISLIVIGKLERKTYSAQGINKFLTRPDLFPVLFKSSSTYLLIRRSALASLPGSNKLSFNFN